MPYGELIPGMAYLVRRLLENTSNDSFLRASFTENVAPEKLLMNPSERVTPVTAARDVTRVGKHPAGSPRTVSQRTAGRFLERFCTQRAGGRACQVHGELGQFYPLWIGGQAVETAEQIRSVDPGQNDRVIGLVAAAGVAEANRAVAAAREALPAWSKLPVEERADYLRRAAALMRARRWELAAWEIYECGKEWREADGDVCEAIDFCEFYAEQAIRMQSDRGVDVPGEENSFVYLPRGVAAIIAPWNFPLPILTGMSMAALVTGNTVVIKPAEQSPVVAAKLLDILQELDLPLGVVNYLPGRGEVVGAALVEHPDTAIIAFTGSRSVGLAINRRAAETSGQGAHPAVKRVIAEMGGKKRDHRRRRRRSR